VWGELLRVQAHCRSGVFVTLWEDDNVQNEDPNYEGGANGISLNQARKNFSKYGAVQKKFMKDVRKPLPEEIPDE
jgi:hypothetical protein